MDVAKRDPNSPFQREAGAAGNECSQGLVERLAPPGYTYPRVIVVAGTYYRRGGREFWDARSGGTAVAVDLDGAKYRRLVVDVEDPEAIVELINGVAGRAA